MGRAVFLGDTVKDERFNWAEFADLRSSPPTMEAAKAFDAMGIVVRTHYRRRMLRMLQSLYGSRHLYYFLLYCVSGFTQRVLRYFSFADRRGPLMELLL
jgi:hypothetical protein